MKMKGFKKGMALILALAVALSFGLTFKPMEVNAADIDSIVLTGTQPTAGQAFPAATDFSTTSAVVVQSVTWLESDGTTNAPTTAAYNTQYMVKIGVALEDKTNDSFGSTVSATVNGQAATFTIDSGDPTEGVVTYTFPATAKASVNGSESAVALNALMSGITQRTYSNGTDQAAIQNALNAHDKVTLTMEDGASVEFDITWQTDDPYNPADTGEQKLKYYPQTSDEKDYDVNNWLKANVDVEITVEADNSVNPPVNLSLKSQNKDTFTLGGNEDLVLTLETDDVDYAELMLFVLPKVAELNWDPIHLADLEANGIDFDTLQQLVDDFISGKKAKSSLSSAEDMAINYYHGTLYNAMQNGNVKFIKLSSSAGDIIIDGKTLRVSASKLNSLGEGTYYGSVYFENSNGDFNDSDVDIFTFTITGSGSQGSAAKTDKSPDTGDGNAVGLFLALAILSIGGVVVTAKSKKVAE